MTDPHAVEGVTLDPLSLVQSVRTYVAEAKDAMDLLPGRCEMCDWPLRETVEAGCTADSCCYRPSQPSEVARLNERRRSLGALTRLTQLADAAVRLAAEVERLTNEHAAERDAVSRLIAETKAGFVAERDALRTQLAETERRAVSAMITHAALLVRLSLPEHCEKYLRKRRPEDFDVVLRDEVVEIALSLRRHADTLLTKEAR